MVESYFVPGRGLALAALREGRLLGFSLSHAVDGAAYDHGGYVGREGLKQDVSMCLFHVLALIAQRSAGVSELANGLHAREAASLCAFKRSQGCEVAYLPARAWFAPLVEPLLHRAWPHKYYRLTGRG